MSSKNASRSNMLGRMFRLGWLLGLVAGIMVALTEQVEIQQPSSPHMDGVYKEGSQPAGRSSDDLKRANDSDSNANSSASTQDAPL